MNLLITGAWYDAKENIMQLEAMGHNVIFLQDETEVLPHDYKWVEGVICNGLFLHHPIEKFTDLCYIQLTSAGLDRVPVDYIRERGIEIHNAGGVYSVPMAESAVAGVLAIYRRMPFFMRNQERHLWEKRRDLRELSGRNVCIIGCGSVGCECARRFSALGCGVTGADIAFKENAWFSEILPVEKADEALACADIAVLALPLTDKTYHFMNAERLSFMKNDAVLVNISRGGVTDTEALIGTLKARPDFGAVLDVCEEEPLSADSPLWDMRNVIITPHTGFAGDGNRERLDLLIMKNLQDREERLYEQE